jgi:hypothetical protein
MSESYPQYCAHRLPGESVQEPTLGFEVEFELNGSSRTDACSPNPWVAERGDDCSLHNGAEYRSKVGTLGWWASVWPQFTAWCAWSTAQGRRAYDTTTCGGHVHVSFGGLTAPQLRRMYELVYGNPEFWFRVSQRTRSRLDNWAPLGSGRLPSPERADEWATRQMKSPVWWVANPYGGGALALHAELGTVEFRMYRGTLSADGWWDRLCFTHAARAFACTDLPELPEHFVDWMLEQPQYAVTATRYLERAARLGFDAFTGARHARV